MKVAIVGGNGHIGMELSLLLREAGATPHPIVRNRLGAAFFEDQDVSVRTADVTDEEEASRALGDVDAVVISARTNVESRSPSEVKDVNRSIIEGAVENTPPDAAAVLFSSVSAVEPSTFYGRAKRYEEEVFTTICEETGRSGYALRLGHVLGPRQSWSAQLEDRTAGRDSVDVAADPDRPSNVVHTVTVCDAVMTCARKKPNPGTYTCVNEPQWTWREVFDFYVSPDTALRFHPPSTDSQPLAKRVVSTGASLLEPYRAEVFRFLEHVPNRAYYEFRGRYKQRLAAEDIGELTERNRLDLLVFDFEAMPGPFLPDLPETRSRLDREQALEAVFGPHGNRTAPSVT